MLWPLPVICLAALGLGITMEIMMVQWTVALTRHIPPGKLARVSSYDALGSVMAMPIGALIAGPWPPPSASPRRSTARPR